MSVNWTLEQLDAINARGGNILVAAAAGSGKTAVLVERVIRMITDRDNPVSVDKLLVLTFTDAAASEMRRKISLAIEQKLSENPDDKWLRQQSLCVGSACISTIHSFCSRILTNNAHITDLPTDFSLIDDTENQVLRLQALDTVLEAYYSRIDKKHGFRELVHGWGGIKGDESLRELILHLHDFSRSLAYPKKWLRNAYREDYSQIAKAKTLASSARESLLKDKLYECALNIYNGLCIIRNIVDAEVPSDHAYFHYYNDMADGFCSAFDKLGNEYSVDGLTHLITSLEIKSAPRKTGLDESTAVRITKIRDASVKAEKKKAESFLSALSGENISHISKCAPVVKTLCSIVRQTERIHQRLKKERSSIDFSDLEHGLLHLLVNERGEETDLCLKLRAHYHEILLDEFQDTNSLQFEIFSRLSKEEGNLFMVGDVKQCIYKFRNADPSIFMNLYSSYDKCEGGRLIRLFKNFRSRPEVIDSVNYVFSSVMSEKLGGVNYTEDEYLKIGAAYPEGNGFDTEIMLTDTAELKSTDPTLAELEAREIEAKNTASKIKKLIYADGLKVTDRETSQLRDATYGDITILCRGSKECRIIEEELMRQGIPTISESGRLYLESLEVDTVLCFLRIIDNPLQDIPLIAVMRSAMFNFTADELARIRASKKDVRFYDALCIAAENDKKCADFLSVLLDLRSCAKYMGTDELVWKICNELHYSSIVGSMQNGALRKANLNLLLERCSDFEQGSLRGLFNFMKYIEMLKDTGKDLAPAEILTQNNNSVRIMTMHKSKGLEFPVVILFGTVKKFYLGDIQKNIIWDEKLGIGLDYVDTRQRVRFPSPIRKMIETELLSSLKSEEMRLLYVAMTRAREKLIISAAIKQRDNKWAEAEFSPEGFVYPLLADKITCMRDWILSALMNSPYAEELRSRADRADICMRKDLDAKFHVYSSDDMEAVSHTYATSDITDSEPDSIPDMEARLTYSYPHTTLRNLPIKLSVSELKRRRMPDNEPGTRLLKEPSSFISTGDIKGSERGTITHFVLQHIDVAKTNSQDEIARQIDEMISSGIISKLQSEVVDTRSIFEFFRSSLGKRLKNAEKFEREFDFYMLVSPDEVTDNVTSDAADDVILQGIADCLFFEPDGIVLIDYKTDRVGNDGILKRSEFYRMQIELYARGISRIFNIPVKEKYLYFLNCNEAVLIK